MSPSPPLRAVPALQQLMLLLSLLLSAPAAAHQSISYPYPISRDIACRIGFSQNCPGPCPRGNLRADVNPENPSFTAQRGQYVTINTMANNHRGGFSRWTVVHVRDMHNRQKHAENAFLYTCADVNIAYCSRRNKKRDCPFDKKNQYYRHPVQIPANLPDGVYVLGWAWYGGGERWGLFGDYYDCMYMRVRGGPTQYTHFPAFRPGRTATGVNGKCRATVNRLGVCTREPCQGGGRFTTLQKPHEFNYRHPGPIPRSRFLNPYIPKGRLPSTPYVFTLTVRSADVPSRIYTSSARSRNPYLFLRTSMRVTVTCEVGGNVQSVIFFVNGRRGRVDYSRPYTIAGDYVDGRTRRVRYAPWKMDIDRKIITLSCKAVGYDGRSHFRTIELSTDF